MVRQREYNMQSQPKSRVNNLKSSGMKHIFFHSIHHNIWNGSQYIPHYRTKGENITGQNQIHFIDTWNSWSLTVPLWVSSKEELQSGVQLGTAHVGLPSSSHRLTPRRPRPPESSTAQACRQFVTFLCPIYRKFTVFHFTTSCLLSTPTSGLPGQQLAILGYYYWKPCGPRISFSGLRHRLSGSEAGLPGALS